MPYLSFHLSILMISRALAKPRSSTYFWPLATSAGWFLSGRFFVGCSGWEGSRSGCRWSKTEAILQVREQKTGGLACRRYVFRQACLVCQNDHLRVSRQGLSTINRAIYVA